MSFLRDEAEEFLDNAKYNLGKGFYNLVMFDIEQFIQLYSRFLIYLKLGDYPTAVIRFRLDFKATPNEKSHNCCTLKLATSIPVGRHEQVILQQVRDRERGSRTSSSQGLTSPWSVVVHGVVHDGERSLEQPDRTSTRRRVLPTPHQFTFQPERLGRVPHAGPPTYQDHED